MNPQDDPENTPIYPTASDVQCLRLSQKLYAKELELQIQLTTIETLKALLAANKL